MAAGEDTADEGWEAGEGDGELLAEVLGSLATVDRAAVAGGTALAGVGVVAATALDVAVAVA